MKKKVKKLVLAKETLRSLDTPGLRRAAGATALQTNCVTACTQPADTQSCGSCVGCNGASGDWTCGCVSNQVACAPTGNTCYC
jgi:hypothetical protein